jgi:hypothetical protein
VIMKCLGRVVVCEWRNRGCSCRYQHFVRPLPRSVLMAHKLTIWCLFSALLVAGWSAQLLAARFSQIERDASASFACGTCMSHRAQRVRTASGWLQGCLASALVTLALGGRKLRSFWRCCYLAICAVGFAALTVYFLEMT